MEMAIAVFCLFYGEIKNQTWNEKERFRINSFVSLLERTKTKPLWINLKKAAEQWMSAAMLFLYDRGCEVRG
ncbi:hypothetical protein A1OW_06485 [Enterovibrio norvegicus]|uniref:hypothetical protein n=1 Tax=Enterovibrio norvegicus TaxID=188144 RepID=UPI0002F95303|nr:hypothetical protein [Enterovibrio norvegicus]OEF53864.1 hypothetical protein A1OW_06485 [Enterovibrio norvegicus]